MDIEAVVVECEARHRSGIPPDEVPVLPGLVEEGRLEIAPVSDDASGNGADALGAKLAGQVTEPTHRVGFAGPRSGGVGVEAAAAHGGIATAV